VLSSTGLGEGENSGWAMSVVDIFVNKNNKHNNDQISSIQRSLIIFKEYCFPSLMFCKYIYHYSKSIETKSQKIFNISINLHKITYSCHQTNLLAK